MNKLHALIQQEIKKYLALKEGIGIQASAVTSGASSSPSLQPSMSTNGTTDDYLDAIVDATGKVIVGQSALDPNQEKQQMTAPIQSRMGAVLDNQGKVVVGKSASQQDINRNPNNVQMGTIRKESFMPQAKIRRQCPNCKKDMGWNNHGECQHCKKYCGCSFDPTNMNDWCDSHRPTSREQLKEQIKDEVRTVLEFLGIYKQDKVTSIDGPIDFKKIVEMSNNNNAFCSTACKSFLKNLEQGQLAMHIATKCKEAGLFKNLKFDALRGDLNEFLCENKESAFTFQAEGNRLIAMCDFTQGGVKISVDIIYTADGWLREMNLNIEE